MRRKDKEITDRDWMESVLRRADVASVAFSDGGGPYVIPLSFAYRDGALYFHSALEGRKLDLMRRDPRVCVHAAVDIELVSGAEPCDYGVRYRSVVCTGTAREIAVREEKRAALDILAEKYAGAPGAMNDRAVDAVAVIEVTVVEMTGKQSGW